MPKTALVSSCLLGLSTRYDGTGSYNQDVIDYLKRQDLTPIPICPEQLAGLPTPRPKCWFSSGDGCTVLDGSGVICDEANNNMTKFFINAAVESCKVAELTNSKLAILKQRSPSCGSRQVHQNGQLITGMGVAAAKLKKAGIRVLSEEDLDPK